MKLMPSNNGWHRILCYLDVFTRIFHKWISKVMVSVSAIFIITHWIASVQFKGRGWLPVRICTGCSSKHNFFCDFSFSCNLVASCISCDSAVSKTELCQCKPPADSLLLGSHSLESRASPIQTSTSHWGLLETSWREVQEGKSVPQDPCHLCQSQVGISDVLVHP